MARNGNTGSSSSSFFRNRKDERAYKDFTGGEFEFDAAVSAIAITAAAQAKTGTEGAAASAGAGDPGKQAKAKYRKGMAVFTYPKGGLMYEAAIGGQKFKFTANGGSAAFRCAVKEIMMNSKMMVSVAGLTVSLCLGLSACSNGEGPVKQNADGTTDVYFGPKPPKGMASNWIQDRAWKKLVHRSAPLQPATALV